MTGHWPVTFLDAGHVAQREPGVRAGVGGSAGDEVPLRTFRCGLTMFSTECVSDFKGVTGLISVALW